MSGHGDEARWLSVREACISATGSMLMSVIGNPLLTRGFPNPPPDEITDFVLECVPPLFAVLYSYGGLSSQCGLYAL